MFVITIDYRSYGVPDEHADNLLKVLSVLQPLKADSSWDPKEYTYDNTHLDIRCVKVHDSEIREPKPKIADNKEINIDQETPF